MNYWYAGVRRFVSWGLQNYFSEIKVHGENHVPATGAVLFTVNHQNAFLDALLIATTNKRFTHFLVRADVFKFSWARRFFRTLNMLPIYRWRDGRQGLANNQEIFERCRHILADDHALMVFPEANHHQYRRLLPLSKGFTRITRSLDTVKIVPVGLNYTHHRKLGGSVSINYGLPITPPADTDKRSYESKLVAAVSEAMQRLITHIPAGDQYQILEDHLNQDRWQYLQPDTCNQWIKQHAHQHLDPPKPQKQKGIWRMGMIAISNILNFLPLLINHFLLKKIGDAVFTSSIKVVAGLFMFPLYYLMLLIVLSAVSRPEIAIMATGLAIASMYWRKWSIWSLGKF